MPKIAPDQNRKYIGSSVVLLIAMCNATRMHILSFVADAEVSVGPLSEMVGLSQSATSQHLAMLRQAGIVSTRRDQQTVF